MHSYETHQIDWHGIAVSVGICPDWSRAYRDIYGYPLAHLTIRMSKPLPITNTGFRSQFVSGPVLEEWGGPLPYVLAWLNAEADTTQWKEAEAAWQQLSLF